MTDQTRTPRRDDRFSPRTRLFIMVAFAIVPWIPIGAVYVAAA